MSLLTTDNPHQSLLEQRLPSWAQHAQPEHWQPMVQTQHPAQGFPEAEADWFANAAPDLREAVLASQLRLQRSQHTLARSLRGLKQIAEFAEPLLQARLLSEHQLNVPLRSSELMRVYPTWHWQALRYLNKHERHSLLQAALQNFADDLTFSKDSALALAGDAQVHRTSIPAQLYIGFDVPAADILLPSETYEIKPLPLSPAAFAQTCRALDLGQCYQAHLQEVFESPHNCNQLHQQAIAVHCDQLRLAADLAYLRHSLNGNARDQVQRLLDGQQVSTWQLSLFGITLHEAIIIDGAEAGLLLYLPGNETQLQQFTDLDALAGALHKHLQPLSSRQHFKRYVSLDQQAHLLNLLQQNLDAAAGDLHLNRLPITEPLFSFLQHDHVACLKAEARVVAVPTADADEAARQKRHAQWISIGLDVLNVAGFFVPALGVFMLGVAACQLLDEAVEGAEAWHQGDRHLALRHFEAVGLNLALMGGLAAAGHVVPKLFNSPLMESLDEVHLDDGSYRLWQADLAPYRSPVVLPDSLRANRQGQYLHEDKYFIRMDGQCYEQRFDVEHQQWRIVHPEQPTGWQPPLEHNGEGAWRGAHEQPQLWDLPTLVRRLDQSFSSFSDLDLHVAAQISNVSEARLRQVHLSGQPTPVLLGDTLGRLASMRESLGMGDELALDEDGLKLCKAYPRLNTPLARRLLGRLHADELHAWQSGEPLPVWLEKTAQQVHDDLPLTRALEGLHFPGLNSEDSDRLMFACLDRLPGWSLKVRLELRGGSPQGPLLASAGAEEATQRCLVIKSSEGYEAYLGERPAPLLRDHDLSRAVLDALPAVRRQALVADTGAEGLRQHVQALVDRSRLDMARRLWGRRPGTWRQHGRLRGGTDLPFTFPAISPLRTSLTARYRRLFPAAGDQEVEAALADWRRNLRSPEVELRVLKARLQALRRDLATWAQDSSPRRRATQPIIDAWRRNAPYTLASGETIQRLNLAYLGLEDHDLASLVLPDDFHHVFDLNLSGNRQLSQVPYHLLSRFTGLQRLQLGNCRFDRAPHLFNAPELAWLDLQNNRVTWDAWAQAALERMPNLSVLDLSDNPLLQAPDLSRMHNLRSLFISNASLTQMPAGLASMNNPLAIDLSNNQFITLPNNFTVPMQVGQAMSLESEWLNPQMRLQIDTYYDTHGVDLLVAESDYEELLQNSDASQQQIWNRLPLQYRRDLRQVLDLDNYLRNPPLSLDELWRRLARMDVDSGYRQRALARPARELLDLTL